MWVQRNAHRDEGGFLGQAHRAVFKSSEISQLLSKSLLSAGATAPGAAPAPNVGAAVAAAAHTTAAAVQAAAAMQVAAAHSGSQFAAVPGPGSGGVPAAGHTAARSSAATSRATQGASTTPPQAPPGARGASAAPDSRAHVSGELPSSGASQGQSGGGTSAGGHDA